MPQNPNSIPQTNWHVLAFQTFELLYCFVVSVSLGWALLINIPTVFLALDKRIVKIGKLFLASFQLDTDVTGASKRLGKDGVNDKMRLFVVFDDFAKEKR